MKLSIAMCTYNGERYLSEQLDSIANQTHQPAELVICDDKSTDNTFILLHDFSERAPFPVLLHQNRHNVGSTKNFEQAIGRCNGDVIILADQDDIWYPHKLETIERWFASNKNIGLVFSNGDIIDTRTQLTGKTLWDSIHFTAKLRERMKVGDAFQVLIKQNYVTGAAMAFRSTYRDNLLPISQHWVHDGWIAMIISLQAEIALLDEPLIQYRKHDTSQIGTSDYTTIEWLQRSRQTPPAFFLNRLQAIEDMQRHVRMLNVANVEAIQSELSAKARHLQFRAEVTGGGLRGCIFIAHELITGRYHRYSMGGSKAALRDVLSLL